jgi:hypothetical protein
MIYFVQGYNGAIKIGWADNVDRRVAELQSASPVELKELGRMHGSNVKEKELHTRFARYRIRGEWFEPAEELLEYIKHNTQRGKYAYSSLFWGEGYGPKYGYSSRFWSEYEDSSETD